MESFVTTGMGVGALKNPELASKKTGPRGRRGTRDSASIGLFASGMLTELCTEDEEVSMNNKEQCNNF